MLVPKNIRSCRALIVCPTGAELKNVSVEKPLPEHVSIQVFKVGLCRTDFYAYKKQISTKPNLIPGHELVGKIVEVGTGVDHSILGKKVTINPVVPCETCHFCRHEDKINCHNFRFIGVDIDGALSELINLPLSQVFLLDESIDDSVGCLTEPVAACLAPTELNEFKEKKGLIFGENRIAKLTARLMKLEGFSDVRYCDSQHLESQQVADQFDFVVETFLNEYVLRRISQILKPCGTLVLKSRSFSGVSFIPTDFVKKQIAIRSVNYGNFQKAIKLLSTGSLDVSDLIGKSFPFRKHRAAFEYAESHPESKTYIELQEPY